MQIIVRKEYLNELIELYGTPDIKVITGIRRNGKSVLLQEFVSYLQSLEEPVNIVMINLQEVEFEWRESSPQPAPTRQRTAAG